MANNPIPDAALAKLDRQYGRAESETGTKIDLAVAMNAAYLAYPALRQRLFDAESRLAEVERERDQLRALADTARDGMRQLGEDLEASRAEVERLRVALDEARKDNEELDGTDAAHPAWWRGNDAGVAQVCAQINAILDGADVFGTASEPWESTRRRVAEARKNLERLREVLEAGKADRWAATVGNTETNAFRPSGWVVRAETALALTPASTKPTTSQPR